MSGGTPTPKKMWFTKVPNIEDPWTGGGLLNILTWEGERVTVGLDLARLLSLQRALANLVELVIRGSVPDKPAKQEPENPITEEEIQAATKLLDGDLSEFFNTDTEKKEDDSE